MYLIALDGLGEPLTVPWASDWWGSVVAELHRHCVSGRSTAVLFGRKVDLYRAFWPEIKCLEAVAIICR